MKIRLKDTVWFKGYEQPGLSLLFGCLTLAPAALIFNLSDMLSRNPDVLDKQFHPTEDLMFALFWGSVGAIIGLILGYVNQLACRRLGTSTTLPYRLAWLIPIQFAIILSFIETRFLIETALYFFGVALFLTVVLFVSKRHRANENDTIGTL